MCQDYSSAVSNIKLEISFYVVSLKGEDLKRALYNVPWYNWTPEHQKTYSILLNAANQGLNVSVFNMVNISNDLLKKVIHFG